MPDTTPQAQSIKWRDFAERLFWTFVVAFVGTLTAPGMAELADAIPNIQFSLDITTLDAAFISGVTSVMNAIALFGRARLAVLPDPGEGLPNLRRRGTSKDS